MPTNSIWDLSEIGSRHQRKTPFFICRLPDCLYTAEKVLSRPQTPWSRADARQFAGELPRGLDRADGALPTRRGERRSLDCRPEKKARPQVSPRSPYCICRHTLSKRAGGIATSRRRQCAGWGARGARVCASTSPKATGCEAQRQPPPPQTRHARQWRYNFHKLRQRGGKP